MVCEMWVDDVLVDLLIYLWSIPLLHIVRCILLLQHQSLYLPTSEVAIIPSSYHDVVIMLVGRTIRL